MLIAGGVYMAWQNRNGKVRAIPFEEHKARVKQAKRCKQRITSAWDQRLGCRVYYELHRTSRQERAIKRRTCDHIGAKPNYCPKCGSRRKSLTTLTAPKRVRMVGQPLPMYDVRREQPPVDSRPRQCSSCQRIVSYDGRGHKESCTERWGEAGQCVGCGSTTPGSHYVTCTIKQQPGSELVVIPPVEGELQVVQP